MKKLVAIFLVAILACSVTIPNVFSDNGKNNDGTNNNQGSQNSAKENETDNHGNQAKIHFGFSNATSINITLPNGTKITFGFSNGTNRGQQISAFVHLFNNAFKQQESQSKQIIKDCRDKAKQASSPADRKNIMNECKAKLKDIQQQFKGEHKQFQVDFKQFRGMVIGNNQGMHQNSHVQIGDNKNQNNTQTIQKQGHGNSQKHQNHKQNHGKQD